MLLARSGAGARRRIVLLGNIRARVAAEFVGTAFLLAAVVGSGITAERLSGGNNGLALLVNAVATGGALIAILLSLGPVSGAHLNPAVTIALAMQGRSAWCDVPPYLVAQVSGAVAGTALANAMFGFPALFFSTHARTGGAQFVAECVATFGLLAVIFGCLRANGAATPYAVAAYIVAAYLFTPSTSFANPAVTIARSMTNTFAGIRPADTAPFVAAQLIGASAATIFFSLLTPKDRLST